MLHRLLLLTLMLFCTTSLFAQNTIEETTLDELEITSKRKRKIKKYKLNGFPPDFIDFSKNEFVVTNFENLPKGKIISATFYFNTWLPSFANSVNEEFKIDYKDVDFGVLVYNMKKDGTLGNLISDSEVKFTIKKEQRDGFKIDVSSIDFPLDKFFLGIKALSDVKTGEGSFYLRLCEPELNYSFQKFEKSEIFNPINESNTIVQQPFALKTTLEIEQ